MTTNPSEYERQDFGWISHRWHRIQTHGSAMAVGILVGGLALVAASETLAWEQAGLGAVNGGETSPAHSVDGATRPERSSRALIRLEGAAGVGGVLLVVGAGLLVGRRIQTGSRDSDASSDSAPVPVPTPDFTHEQFRAFALASMEGILLLDGMSMLGANSAAVELFGRSESQMRNRPVLELIDPSDHGRAAVQFQSGTDSDGEYIGVCLDGSRVILSVQCRRSWYQGRFIRALCFRKVADVSGVIPTASSDYRLRGLEMERRRIARDIHDELGSTLTSIRLLCDEAALELASPDPSERSTGREKLCQISSLTETLTTGLEGIVWTVRPENDSLESIATYLCRLAPEMLRIGGIRCRLTVPVLLPVRTVPAEMRRGLMLVVKESLHNVLKHSEATAAELRIRLDAEELTVEVIDDGRGFDPIHAATEASGDGLANMRHRIQETGGSLRIESQPGQGTQVSIRLHLPASIH